MPYQLFVEIGRVVRIARGPDAGKIAVIVNVIDQNRALIDGPITGINRQGFRLKDLYLTKYMVEGLTHKSNRAEVTQAMKDAKIVEQWEEDPANLKMKKMKARREMGDFDRFKLRAAKSKRNKILYEMVEKRVAALKEAGKM